MTSKTIWQGGNSSNPVSLKKGGVTHKPCIVKFMHGYQHTAVNCTATALLCLPLYLCGYPITSASLTTGLMIGTLLITPDLDLHLNDARRNWGPLRFIWTPYAALSRHRGMSHTYLLGPSIRLAYLALWTLPVFMLWHSLQPASIHLDPRIVVLVLVGYFLAQWLHLICDRIYPFKPARKKRLR